MTRATPFLPLATALGLALLLALPALPALADPEQMEIDQQMWVQRLEDARERLKRARTAVEEGDAAYAKGRHRTRLRGEPREEIVAEREAAALELAAAEEAWPKLLEEARRAGLPPGVLRPFEDSVPPSAIDDSE